MILAPIALFTYNRPDHTRKTLEALLANTLAAESEIYIFSDAPKKDIDNTKVSQTREILNSLSGFKKKHLFFRDQNLGLANSIISGVTEIVNSHGRIIVMEDDLVTAPSFLKYMNDALEFYENEERVISIHGYLFPLRKKVPQSFFLKGADCWGWATWKRGWQLFNSNGSELRTKIKNNGLLKRFNYHGTYPFSKMLNDQILGRNDSWAIRWYASALIQDKLTLYPGESLVSNIGNDGSGTHQSKTDSCDVVLSRNSIRIEKIPIEENASAFAAFVDYLKSVKNQRILSKIKKLLFIKYLKP